MPPHLAVPVPPSADRVYSVLSHTSIDFSPPLKYGPAGDAISAYRYSADGRTPSPTSVASMNGRR